MSMLPKALTGLAAVAFVLAVVEVFIGSFTNIRPHTFSYACTNLALLAIALVLIADRGAAPSK